MELEDKKKQRKAIAILRAPGEPTTYQMLRDLWDSLDLVLDLAGACLWCAIEEEELWVMSEDVKEDSEEGHPSYRCLNFKNGKDDYCGVAWLRGGQGIEEMRMVDFVSAITAKAIVEANDNPKRRPHYCR